MKWLKLILIVALAIIFKDRKISEIPSIDPPYKVEGPPKEARKSYYEFAKKKLGHLKGGK